jgi:hypothetical protein
MSVAHDLIIDQLSPPVDGEKHLATWYTQGHSDGLGDRLLMFDNTSAPSWEILRFRQALARDPRFEAGVRERIKQLASFAHPAFPTVRPLRGLGHEDGLAVVSTYATGVRLSEAMKRPRSAAFAIRLIRQLAPALAALQQHESGIFHGALEADRIVVTADGRLNIREHMLGAALASLELPAQNLWADFRLLTSPTPTPTFDSRTDVVQLGLVALSLMAGRRVGPDDYPDKVEGLLDEIAERNGRQSIVIFRSLRYWLERALQLDDYMFETAQEASDALDELHDETGHEDVHASGGPTLSNASGRLLDDGPWPQRPQLIGPGPLDDLILPLSAAHDQTPVSNSQGKPADDRALAREQRRGRVMTWTLAAVAALAIGEAAFIGRLLYGRAAIPPPLPSTAVMQSGPIRLLPTIGIAQIDPRESEAPNVAEAKGTSLSTATPSSPVAPAPTASPRTGGFRLSSSIEVHVLDNARLLGSSSDGPIIAAAGRHEFDFVNSAIGYRARRVVEIKPGQITLVAVTIPNGTLNINAVPWAAVWIDGSSYGETPLGNISIPPGEHEIVFRHPQLGERREKTMVRADGATRVTVTLQR